MEWWRQIFDAEWVGSTISLVGLLLGLLSLIAAIVIYRASRIGGRLVYQRQGLNIISGEPHELPSEVEILFKGHPVPRLTKTLLTLWNSGTALIRGSDVVSESPIQFVFSDGSEILRLRILKVTRPQIKFNAHLQTKNRNIAVCQFDYLDPGDGAVVEILHTDEERYPCASGTIRGLPKGLLDAGRVLSTSGGFDPLSRLLGRRRMLITMAIFGLCILLFTLLSPESLWVQQTTPNRYIPLRWMFGVVGTIYAVPPGFMLWSYRRRFPKLLTLEDLEE